MEKKYYFTISFISILAALAILFASVFLSSSNSAALESENTRLNVERAMNAINDELRGLDITVNDYAEWDDTYYFMGSLDQTYIKSNLTDNTFRNNKLNVFAFVSSSGQIIWAKSYDLKNQKEVPFQKAMAREIVRLCPNNNTAYKLPGIVCIEDKPMLLAARPIMTSLGNGPARGTLVMGRYLDQTKMKQLARSIRLSMGICQVNKIKPSSDYSKAFKALQKQETFIYELSDDTIAGYKLIRDIKGKPALVLRVDVKRTIHKKNQRDLLYFALSLLLIGVVFGLINAWDAARRREAEEKLKYLHLHDILTGLHNRLHFEQELCRLAAGRYYPVAAIMADIDGLKLVNDTLGHINGDILLKGTAEILKKCLRKSDVITRIGGDEFAVLLPHTDMNTAERLRKNIVEAISYYNCEHPELHLSLSIGVAVSTDESMPLGELCKEADNNMYKEKLHSSLSARSAIVNALMKTVEARNFVTQGHANRVQELIIKMAQTIGFSEANINDLKLLAQFHDIGKVGVPDQILSKPGPLNPAELVEMRQHCEIGYRIARSAPELIPISDWILKHHEWWNGEGYPQGLKEEEIPVECRMLAIIDAYDAMTNDRPYRKAMTEQEAKDELRKNAGIQFDPALVELFMSLTMTAADHSLFDLRT